MCRSRLSSWPRHSWRGLRSPLACLSLIIVLLAPTGPGATATPGVPAPPRLPAGLRQPRCPGLLHAAPLPFAAVAPRWGTVYEGTLSSPALHGVTRPYEIYLPPGYWSFEHAVERYPVLYLLHGAPGVATDWLCRGRAAQTTDALIHSGRIMPLIIVMPDGNGGFERDTQYVNSWNGRTHAMDYVAHDLVSSIDAHFRTSADAAHRAIGGFSEGGYGAMNVGLHHPEEFQTIVSMAGYFVALRNEVFGANDPFGHNWDFRHANSPYDYVDHVPRVHTLRLMIADSTGDDPYTRYAREFSARLSGWHIPYTLLLLPPHQGGTARP